MVDIHFEAPGLTMSPPGDPHVGDAVNLIAHLSLEGMQKWTKHGVVIETGGPGEADSLGVSSPSVLIEGGVHKMWYAGSDAPWPESKILYAESPDGISWTKRGVVLGGDTSGLDKNVHYGFVMIDEDIYKMWYSGYDRPDLGGHWRIFYATSADGMTWTRQGLVLDIGAPGSYDDNYVYQPFVMNESGVYKMWYSGDDGTNVRLMYATSSDGTVWTKQGVAIDPGPPGSLDDYHLGAASIIREGGGYQLWYRANDGLNNRIFYATSQDGLIWSRMGLVLDLGPRLSTDSKHVMFPSVMHNPGSTYKMWYTGRDGYGTDRIHFANLTALPLPMDVDVGYYLDVVSPGNKIGTVTLRLGAIESSIATIGWTAGPPGDHVLFSVIDPSDNIVESNEDNNTASLRVKVVGIQPVADAGPDISILEGQVARLDASSSYDSDGVITNYTWDLDVSVDSDGDGNPTNDIDAWTTKVDESYGDDGVYCALLTVTDDDGLTGNDTACVTVVNVAPTVSIRSVWSDMNITLRVAGRKWNKVEMELYENGTYMASTMITRMPGSPDDQSAAVGVSLNMLANHTAVIRYFPDESFRHGIGGNPVWLILSNDGKGNTLHHTFNVQQSIERNSSHWNHIEPWLVDVNAAMTGLGIRTSVNARDPGSDDLRLEWSSGESIVFFNDGSGPDPPRSPQGTYPFIVETVMDLTYHSGGPLTLTVRDDDGDSSSVEVNVH